MKTVWNMLCTGVLFLLCALTMSSHAQSAWTCQKVKGDQTGSIKVCFKDGSTPSPGVVLRHWRFTSSADQEVTFSYSIYGMVNGQRQNVATRTLTLAAHQEQSTNESALDQLFGAELVSAEIRLTTPITKPASASAKNAEPVSTPSAIVEPVPPTPDKNWCMSDAYVMPGACKCMPSTKLDTNSKTGRIICRRNYRQQANSNKKDDTASSHSVCNPAITSCIGQTARADQPSPSTKVKAMAQPVRPYRVSIARQIATFYR